jgi:hypothetical protein
MMRSSARPRERWDVEIKRWVGRAVLLLLIGAGAAFYVHGCSARTMTLSWEDTSENEDGFRIYRITGDHKTMIAEVAPNVTRYVDKNAPRDACYVVTAFNAAGESTPTGSACRTTESVSR